MLMSGIGAFHEGISVLELCMATNRHPMDERNLRTQSGTGKRAPVLSYCFNWSAVLHSRRDSRETLSKPRGDGITLPSVAGREESKGVYKNLNPSRLI
jgi:hypothetical protein